VPLELLGEDPTSFETLLLGWRRTAEHPPDAGLVAAEAAEQLGLGVIAAIDHGHGVAGVRGAGTASPPGPRVGDLGQTPIGVRGTLSQGPQDLVAAAAHRRPPIRGSGHNCNCPRAIAGGGVLAYFGGGDIGDELFPLRELVGEGRALRRRV
jgi:hypothetical protein